MRILDKNIRYLHPVMSENSRDYTSYDVDISFEDPALSGDEIQITSNFSVSNSFLKKRIEEGNMGMGYFVACQDTLYNRLVEIAEGHQIHTIDRSELFGTVELRPVIFSIKLNSEKRHADMNAEFGDVVTIEPALLTMVGPKFKFRIEPEKFQPFGALYQLAIDDELEPGSVAVDTSGDKISILAETETHSKIWEMRNKPEWRDLLMNAIYLPAVMETLYAMREDDGSLAEKAWFDVILAKCDQLNFNPIDSDTSLYTMAQELMQLPVKRIFAFHEDDKS